MIRKALFSISVLLFLGFADSNPGRQTAEIALVIDLSGSTNGLLDDVRDNLWLFSKSFREAFPEHELRIGVVGYSRGSFGMQNSYVRVLSDLTTNYDLISYRLFDLVSSVEKGDQYVGAAIKTAVGELDWLKGNTKKVMLLFGNSSPALGAYDYNKAVDWAIDNKIIIHSIYCSRGDDNPRYLAQWHSIANRTGGSLHKIAVTHRSPNKFTSHQTEKLKELNNVFNDTYIPYSREGAVNYKLMLAADVNSLQMSELFFHARCDYKISDSYLDYLASFDLVSYATKNNTLPSLNRRYLPDELARSTDIELIEIAKIKAHRRTGILVRMNEALTVTTSTTMAVNPIDSIILESLTAKSHGTKAVMR